MNNTDTMIAAMTDKVVAAIEGDLAGLCDWNKPWMTLMAGSGIPINALTENQYRGMNTIVGMVEVMIHEYPTNVWATYRQWIELEGQVQKGQKGTPMLRWVDMYSCQTDTKITSKPCPVPGHIQTKFLSARPFTVFNQAQQVGWEPDEELFTHDPIDEAEAYLTATGANIERKISNDAFFSPIEDKITLPVPEQFENLFQFYGTAFHELTHWTGHKDRLDRLKHLGLEIEPHPEHMAYLAGWLKVLKAEPRALYNAAKLAQAALTHTLALQPIKEEEHATV